MSRAPTIRASAAAAALLASSAAAQTPHVQTVLSNGTTATRYDMVILGDGYQAFEEPQFDQDVSTFLTALFQKQPYQTFAAYYNVHTVFRASAQSGADRPDETPPVFVTTAYEATYDYGGTDRCLYIQNTSQALADAALAPANEGRVFVLVNDDRYGGCAATFAVSYNGSQMGEVQSHELGHSLGQLADEYDYPYNTYTGGEPSAVNLTTSPTGQKWSIWHGTQGIGAFEGAGYYLYGLFRPRSNCLMRSLGQVLCRVCQENIVKITNSIVTVIDSFQPTAANVNVTVPNVQPFAITHFVPAGNNPLVQWSLDGAPVPGANGTSFLFDPVAAGAGPHTLTVSVLDQTPLVRTDPLNVMRETHTWQVLVSDPTAAQLRLPAFTTSQLFADPGAVVTLSTTITNDGPAGAGPFAVEFFLNGTSTFTPTTGTLLGRVDLPGLAATQSSNVQQAVQLPWSLPPQLQWLFAVVDRAGAVHEGNEGDNQRVAVFFGQSGPCATGLEFQDPLTEVARATLSLAAGGVVHPTVVARCADPAATLYLVAWTGSGTSPGLALAPGLVLPLNPDPLTQAGLDGLNGAVFGGFLGILDATGIGRATFTLPPAVGLSPGPTHFATVLLGATTLFTDVSNAVELTLLP